MKLRLFDPVESLANFKEVRLFVSDAARGFLRHERNMQSEREMAICFTKVFSSAFARILKQPSGICRNREHGASFVVAYVGDGTMALAMEKELGDLFCDFVSERIAAK